MNLERLMLILAGLAIIAACFLPFYLLELNVFDITLSKLTLNTEQYVRAGLDAAQIGEGGEGNGSAGKLIDILGQELKNAAKWQDYAALAGIVFVLLGPIFYLLYGLGYLFRGLAGKQFKHGIFFNILYPIASFGILYWISTNNLLNLDVGFLNIANVGFWISFAAIWVAGFSLLFAKKI